jgi:ABC-2 type transport system permease protein
MTRAIRSELLKIRTTNLWWWMTLGILAFTGLALLVNATDAHFQFQEPHLRDFGGGDIPAEEQQARYNSELRAYQDATSPAGLAKIAANIYTSGQTMGALLILILGALVVTNEYFHQTATATFLATPRRALVIYAKFIAGAAFGLLAWFLVTAVDLVVGFLFLQSEHRASQLDQWSVIKSMLLNLAVFAIWSVLGIALGCVIRSQIGAVVTGTVAYLAGLSILSGVFFMVHEYLIKKDWVLTAQVILPATASQVMVTPGKAFPDAPDQWVGAVVLIAYGLVGGVIGTWLVRRRDIS